MTETSHEQHEALFELEHPPPIRKGSRDYLTHLDALSYVDYRHDTGPGLWTFWALAPLEPRWKNQRVGTGPTDYLWLIHQPNRQLHHAVVDVTTGEILRRRAYDPEHQEGHHLIWPESAHSSRRSGQTSPSPN